MDKLSKKLKELKLEKRKRPLRRNLWIFHKLLPPKPGSAITYDRWYYLEYGVVNGLQVQMEEYEKKEKERIKLELEEPKNLDLFHEWSNNKEEEEPEEDNGGYGAYADGGKRAKVFNFKS